MEIPSDLSTLGVKELKLILEGLGLKSDDCFEKSDLMARVREYQDAKKVFKEADNKRKQSETKQPEKENKKPPSKSQP